MFIVTNIMPLRDKFSRIKCNNYAIRIADICKYCKSINRQVPALRGSTLVLPFWKLKTSE